MGIDELTARVRLASLVEAQTLAHILDEEGIPYRERPYRDTAFDGLGPILNQQVGWGELWVRAADEARALAFLDELRATQRTEAPPAPAAREPEAPPERPAPNLRGLWLLLIVVAAALVAVIAATVIGERDPCEDLTDPAQRAQCEQRRKAPAAPRSWP